MRGFLNELKRDAEIAQGSNNSDLGAASVRLLEAVADTSEAAEHLIRLLDAGKVEQALCGATPFLRLMALATGGVLLARGAAISGNAERAQLARYFADNHVGEAGALKRVVIDGSDSLLAASRLLDDM